MSVESFDHRSSAARTFGVKSEMTPGSRARDDAETNARQMGLDSLERRK
jgi:hypothetical protein